VPEPDPTLARARQRIVLQGDVPSPANPPQGCNFCTRCPKTIPICHKEKPDLLEVEAGRFVACHLFAPATPAVAAPLGQKSNQQGVAR